MGIKIQEKLNLKRTLKILGKGVQGPPKFRVRESKDSQNFGPEGTLSDSRFRGDGCTFFA